MGGRYLFIILYVFLESHLSRGDYRRPERAAEDRTGATRPAPVRGRGRFVGGRGDDRLCRLRRSRAEVEVRTAIVTGSGV